jgi:hypothetical protein
MMKVIPGLRGVHYIGYLLEQISQFILDSISDEWFS